VTDLPESTTRGVKTEDAMETLIKAALIVALGFASAAASAASNKALDTVNRAIDALGGENALRQVKTVVINEHAQHWEPESSYAPSGEMAFAGDSAIVMTWDVANRAMRADWDRTKVRFGGSTKYSEIYADGVGYIDGVNSTSRTQQSRTYGRHSMSGIKLATFLREMQRASPLLVLDMKSDPKALSALPDQSAGGKTLKAVRYDAGRYAFTVMFDPGTGLPARVRSLDTDPIAGDVNYDLVFADWRDVSGIKFAHSQVYELGGRITSKFEVGKIAVNAAVPADRFAIPGDVRARRALPAMGNVPYQWVQRRDIWGNFRDTDELVYDPDAVPAGPTLMDLAPGVSLTSGTSHNNLIVEMKDHLIIFDAPIDEQQSRWTIAAAKAKYRKPVKYLIMTHHHWDHANGARTYVAEGATVIVGKGSKDHFARMFSAPHTVIEDELQRNKRKAAIIEVVDKRVVSDGKRQVGLYHIEHSHSTGTLIVMVPDARLGFVTDIWSPGRDPLPPKATQSFIELVKGVRQHGLEPERIAGGHGTFGYYKDLAALVDKTAPRAGGAAPTVVGVLP
jgi:glyoxylase-like metal-dependent hydrolase (beta-lactamase superfamily II)